MKGMNRKKKLEFKEDENGCFITTSHRLNKYGYCCMSINFRQVRAHRHIYQECFGEIEEGLVVRHKCDVRNCINPEHLELGTQKDNNHDTIARGRNASKLTEKDVIQIKQLYGPEFSGFKLAKMFNVSKASIYKIIHGKAWKQVI